MNTTQLVPERFRPSPDFTKVVRLGTAKTCGGRSYSVFAKIKYEDGRLSITGVEGPLPSGNCLGSCGQIIMSKPKIENLALGWHRTKLSWFWAAWDKWHLNDMQAGSPAQIAELEKHTFPGHPESHYDWACAVLMAQGLHPDADGYTYGSKWLKVDVPADVLDFLRGLPDTDKTPAWV